MKDAAFHSYEKLSLTGLLNDHLLPLTYDWKICEEQPQSLPARVHVSSQIRPFVQMAEVWSAPQPHQTRILARRQVRGTEEQVAMMLVTPAKVLQIPPIAVPLDPETTYTIELETSKPRSILHSNTLMVLNEITHLLHRCTHSHRTAKQVMDFVFLFGPDQEDEQLPHWLSANHDRESALDAFRRGEAMVYGLVRPLSLCGAPFVFREWYIRVDDEYESTVEMECIPLPRRRNFGIRSAVANTSSSPLRRFEARECTVDTLDLKYARFSLFIPSILQHIEIYTVADELRKTILAEVGISDLKHIVNAIVAPSANWITNYQRYEFIGDGILKFVTSVQLRADHGNWHEGYLSKYRDILVCNTNLARAALDRGLDRYILTDGMKSKKWTPPCQSCTEIVENGRDIGTKVLADVVEALIGAAFLDSGLQTARSCINIFIPQIHVAEPKIADTNLDQASGGSLCELESLIGYRFRNRTLLLEAMTHPSLGSNPDRETYQRLEFLGDAILDALVVMYLSQCEPALPQGQMTRLKAALVNWGLLGYLCMACSFPREVFHIKESSCNTFSEVPCTEDVQLWKFMQYQSEGITKAQKSCEERFRQRSTEIRRHLEEGMSYPWVSLAQLSPNKFYSDIVESLIGAIYVDSQGDLSECQRFVDRIGIGPYARRMTERPFDVVHPRNSLQKLAGAAHVCFVTRRDIADPSTFFCEVHVDGAKIAEVDGCINKEAAAVMGADAAVAVLSTITAD